MQWLICEKSADVWKYSLKGSYIITTRGLAAAFVRPGLGQRVLQRVEEGTGAWVLPSA